MTQEERIDRYFSGEMDDLERLEFDKEVMMNNELASALQEYKKLVTGLKTYGLHKKLNAIVEEEALEDTELPKRSSARSLHWYYILIALIIGVVIYFAVRPTEVENNDSSGPALYIAYYYPDPGLPTKMGDEHDFQFNSGMVDYKSGNYSNAITQWSALSDSRAEIKYYLGAAYLAIGDEIKAKKQFNSIDADEVFYDRAQWYLTLMTLKAEDKIQAAVHLNAILGLDQSNYKDRAFELLNKLKE